MALVIRFRTAIFDVSKERSNPINPIHGESLLIWLQEKAKGQAAVTDAEAEDWGWYSFVEWNGRQYMLGSSASDEEEGEQDREWVLQVEKQRSFAEKLFGREQMKPADDCASFFMALLTQESDFKGVAFDTEP